MSAVAGERGVRNALAMPKGSRASSWMFDWTVRALLAVFPVLVLLAVQLQSLWLQSEWVSWTHHVCIIADVVLLVWFFGRLRGDDSWHFWRAPIRRKVALCWLPALVLAVDLLWLEVPGPASETVARDLGEYLVLRPRVASASFLERVRWGSHFSRSICCFARRALGGAASLLSASASSWPRYGM